MLLKKVKAFNLEIFRMGKEWNKEVEHSRYRPLGSPKTERASIHIPDRESTHLIREDVCDTCVQVIPVLNHMGTSSKWAWAAYDKVSVFLKRRSGSSTFERAVLWNWCRGHLDIGQHFSIGMASCFSWKWRFSKASDLSVSVGLRQFWVFDEW